MIRKKTHRTDWEPVFRAVALLLLGAILGFVLCRDTITSAEATIIPPAATSAAVSLMPTSSVLDVAALTIKDEPEAQDKAQRIEAELLVQGYFYDRVPLSRDLQDICQTACAEFDVPYAIALAVMEQESGFEVDAVGVDGKDIGLFQIRTSNHAWLTKETGADPLTPAGNVRCGVWLLGYLLERYDTVPAALTAYRWGSDTEDRQYAIEVLERKTSWGEVLGS